MPVTLWERLKQLLDPSAGMVDDSFSLEGRGQKEPGEHQGARTVLDARIHTESLLTRIDRLLEAAPQGKQALEKVGDLQTSLDENMRRLRELFRAPTNKDFVEREILIATQPPTRAMLVFFEGLADKQTANSNVLEPLMLLAHLDHHLGQGGEAPGQFSVEMVEQRLLTGNQISKKYDLASIAEAVMAGDTVVLMDGAAVAIAVETKSPPARSVSDPKTEQVIWGPHDAFNEAWRVNVALVRRRLKDPRVVTEILTVGEVSKTYIGMMYIDTLVRPELVEEVRRRVEAVKVDIVNGAGILQQYIEDSPSSMLPTCLITERPDRTAAYLSEGHVALFVDTDPHALVCPTTFWSLMQTAEDYYLRPPFGTLLRYIRYVALLVTLTGPSFYIGVVNHNPEMIPTELMLFIAQSREAVPMPAVAELILMDAVFELIREAGTRIPGVIGPTIGLVSSLVLGQAAVEAKIVSPVMILVVAITGLASFAIPNYLVGWGVRVLRFLLLLATTVFGLFGLANGLYLIVLFLAGQRSFGVPFLSPIAPSGADRKDAIGTPPLYQMEERPGYMRPLNQRRQKEIVRTWDPHSPRPESPKGG